LKQNYPNPFNPATTISYYIPEAANVKMEIYNLLGQKIATLTDGLATTGHYKINWDAQNLPGGVYFCKLYAAPVSFSKITNQKVFEKTQKLLLLK
jgi:flagellar hook assembly protein FlgD